eukprot:PhF_6_TR10540/c1_g5_i2/m.16675
MPKVCNCLHVHHGPGCCLCFRGIGLYMVHDRVSAGAWGWGRCNVGTRTLWSHSVRLYAANQKVFGRAIPRRMAGHGQFAVDCVDVVSAGADVLQHLCCECFA